MKPLEAMPWHTPVPSSVNDPSDWFRSVVPNDVTVFDQHYERSRCCRSESMASVVLTSDVAPAGVLIYAKIRPG